MAQKKITDLTLRSSFDATCLVPVDDSAQSWRTTGAQILAYVKAGTAPLTTIGDLLYAGASGVATRLAGNTTTTKKVLVQTGDGTNSTAPAWQTYKAPTVQRFTSGSGTYTTPTDVMFIKVRAVGGGGGGAGGGNSDNGAAGGSGGNTTFGTLITCAGGGGGKGTPGAGTTINSPAVAIVSLGNAAGGGAPGAPAAANVAYPAGGPGGLTPFGGGGTGSGGNNGAGALANTGSGGGGGSMTVASSSTGRGGTGGDGGSYAEAFIYPTASQTFAYAVGAAGTSGGGGTNGSAGGAGAAGVIIVEEYYQ